MIVNVRKTFEKDVKSITERKVLEKLKEIILKLKQSKTLHEVENENIIKMTKGKTSYRITVKNHRIGLYYREGEIDLVRFADRKDIYKLFPPKNEI